MTKWIVLLAVLGLSSPALALDPVVLAPAVGTLTTSTANAGTDFGAVFATNQSGIETGAQTPVPIPGGCVLQHLWCKLPAAGSPGTSNSYAVTVRKNTADCGTFSCTISGSGTTCNDDTDTCTYAQGDLAAVLETTTVGGTTPSSTTLKCAAICIHGGS